MKEQNRYNKGNYRLETLGQQLDNQKKNQAVLQSKEMELLVREESLKAKVDKCEWTQIHINIKWDEFKTLLPNKY